MTIALRYCWSASDDGEEDAVGQHHNVQRTEHVVGFVRLRDAAIRWGGTPARVDEIAGIDLKVDRVCAGTRPNGMEYNGLLRARAQAADLNMCVAEIRTRLRDAVKIYFDRKPVGSHAGP